MPARRIVLCLDGTWNSDPPLFRSHPTNILQIHRRLASRDAAGVEQLSLYEPGVGAGRSHLAGYAGWTVGRIIRRAYLRLARTWREGDELFLFGLSRGAYQALTVARWLDWGGLPELDVSDREIKRRFALYRDLDEQALCALPARRPVPVRFLGAFDTVEALGLPLRGLHKLTRPDVGYHSRELPANVEIARHALALDEERGAFEPAVWPPAHPGQSPPGQSVEQVWFPGSHGDVCGGFGNRAHSDHTLLWMMSEAERAGLAFDPARRDADLSPKPEARPSRPFGGLHRLVARLPRTPGATWPETERLDASATPRRPTLAK